MTSTNKHSPSDHGDGLSTESAPLPADSSAVNQVRDAIATLLNNPENCFEVLVPLTQCLSTSLTDDATLQYIAQLIFQQGVEQPNFRYTGARLCQHISQHLAGNHVASNFRQHLLKICHEECKKRDELVKSPEGQTQLQGMALFVGELLLNVRDEGEVLPIFPVAIPGLLKSLLSVASDDAIKCLAQVLKLTGSTMDNVDPAKLDPIFSSLRELAENGNESSLQHCLVSQLLNLRDKGWALCDTVSHADVMSIADGTMQETEILIQNQSDSCDPASGDTEHCYTEEDALDFDAMDEWNVADDDNLEIVYDDGVPYVILDEGMDPEMMEAYEQFVQETELLQVCNGHSEPK